MGSIHAGRCRQCAGAGTSVGWENHLLAWSRSVDPVAVRGRRIASIAQAAVVLATIVAGLLIIARSTLSFAADEVVDLAPIGAGLLLLLAAIAAAARSQDRMRVVVPLLPATDCALAPPPARVLGAHIDLAAALHPDVRRAIERGGSLAADLHHAIVLPIHCFAGLLTVPTGAAVFTRLGISLDGLANRLRSALAKLPAFAGAVSLAPETVEVLAHAYADAARARRPSIGVLEFLGAVSADEGVVRSILDDVGVNHQMVANAIGWLRAREDLRDRFRHYRSRSALRPRGGMNRTMTAIATPTLDAFGEDLTALAARGGIGLVVGRSREFRELFRAFEGGRPGVLLVGEPGVGKSAIVEGLAERMAADDVPAPIRDKRLVRISVTRLTSGATPALAHDRLLSCLEEAARSRNIVLAIDALEQFTSVSAAGEASVDLADILASVAERTGLSIIGTTTPDAYRRFLERSSLGQLLARVNISAPDHDAAIQIVGARAVLTEARQRVFFSYGAIAACVELADRYLRDRLLPDSAIALADEVATSVRTTRGASQVVTREDVAKRIEERTGIPVTAVTTTEANRLLHLEDELHRRVIGQEEAVRAVAAALRRARVELREGKRPIATFLFLGPTGVGKTELAKSVAATYFGDEQAMVRLDMSEYQDASSVHRLIGAPPGSAGSEAGGQLTEALRSRPFSLILLDELEKAHGDILNLFLQVFDDGRLTDSRGRTVEFTEAIIVATSNAGAPFIQDAVRDKLPVEEIKRSLLERELRGIFRPEFLNRFDGVIVFHPLIREEIERIAKLMLAKVAEQLAVKGIRFRATDAAISELAAAGFDPIFGARPLRRVIQERVQDALATFLLTNQLGRRDTAVLDAAGKITIEKAEEI